MRFVFESLEELAGSRDRILQVLRIMAPSKALRIFVTLNEALNNAALHGEPPIVLEIDKHTRETTGEERLIIKVSCGGRGFVPRLRLSDPEVPRGRGLWLMGAMADRLAFEDRGRMAIMEHRLDRPGRKRSLDTYWGDEDGIQHNR